MLTLFACPKAFRGHFGVIQRNAMRSWALLQPQPEIILFGDEEGIAEAATEFGVRHIPNIAHNEFGTPLLDGLFGAARDVASFDLLAYVNADIILLQDFMGAVERVRAWQPRFLMVGQRTDIDLREPWDFSQRDSAEALRALTLRTGRLRPPEWIDYFVFTKDLADGILPLAIGRLRWDNWLIWHARHSGAPVMDASRAILAVHQNHDYSHHAQGQSGIWQGEEAQRNTALVGGWWRHYTTADATHLLTAGAIKSSPRHWLVKLKRATRRMTTPFWHAFLDVTRPLRHRLGLRKTPSSKSSGIAQMMETRSQLSATVAAPTEKRSAPQE